MSHSDKHQYESVVDVASERIAGVRFRIERMSFSRRLELVRELQGLVARMDFLQAGPQTPEQQAEAALVSGEIDRAYVRWGLRGVEGLEIDGQSATSESLLDKGPEDLVHEAIGFIRRQAGLTEDERKNSASPSTSSAATRPDGSATTVGG